VNELSGAAMRIGVLLREISNQKDAPGIIVLNLLDQLLELDRHNHYVLFYKDRTFFDRYDRHPNITKFLISCFNKLVWDQVLVPIAARKAKLDILFSPKHTLPLGVTCKTVMHLRGSEHWVHPEYYEEKCELFYQKVMLPIFCRKATRLIVESDFMRSDFQRFLRIAEDKLTTIYLAPHDRFRCMDSSALQLIAKKYQLPKKFVLTVTRVQQGTKYYPGKNLEQAIEAFVQSIAAKEMAFVILGIGTKAFLEQWRKTRKGAHGKLMALDFVMQEDLPALYNLAEFFLFPSSYESFGIPLTEAMACGCPIITSNTGACPEIVGKAGLTVNPHDPKAICAGIDRLVHNHELRNTLRMQGFQEAKRFSWRESARQHLVVFQSLE